MYSIFNQLQDNRFGDNGSEAVCVSDSADQAVNYIPCQRTGLREIDVIANLRPAIFLLFIKMVQQVGNS